MKRTPSPRAAGRGFTYLGVMYMVVLLGLTSTLASVVWTTVQRRDNEHELLFVGRQYQAAIERYRQADPSPASRYPRTLDELLTDRRAPLAKHHLRQLYPDPITGGPQWGLIQLKDGAIVGIHSLSERTPMRRNPPLVGQKDGFARSYRQWRFIAPSAVELLQSAELPGNSAAVGVAAGPDADVIAPGSTAADAEPSAPPAEREDQTTVRVRPPRSEDYRLRGPEACDRIAAFDRQRCTDHAARAGDTAGAVCLDSALQRSVACALETEAPLPALAMPRP